MTTVKMPKGIGFEVSQIIKLPEYGLTIELQNNEVKSIIDERKANILPLTSREKEVLKLVSEKKTNSEIAEALFISKRTVEIHRAHIRRKLNIKPAAQLLEYSRQLA